MPRYSMSPSVMRERRRSALALLVVCVVAWVALVSAASVLMPFAWGAL